MLDLKKLKTLLLLKADIKYSIRQKKTEIIVKTRFNVCLTKT